MSDGIYVGMSAAVARAAQLDSLSDNLANAQTPGFKASRPAFETFLGEEPGDKSYTAAVATGTDLRPGQTSLTGNPLDVLPENGAFLAVETAKGQVAFTRNGKLSVDPEGTLLSGGRPVLDVQANPIVLPLDAKVAVDAEGRVTADGQEVAKLGVYQLAGPVDRLGGSLLAPSPEGSAIAVENPRVRSGEIELGNANVLEATVQMVAVQRHFDTSMQAIQTYRRLDERANELGRIR